jgi:hypothetical protein
VDEGRKRVIGIMAAILAARRLAQYDGGKRVPAHGRCNLRRRAMGRADNARD